ncbi:hypothetical protein BH09VER1_BH09VER1_54670 [soil metagenome]
MVTESPGAFGRVTDADTLAPVSKAEVSFPDYGPIVTTDRNGFYDLPHTKKLGLLFLLPWEFQTLPLQVAHPGYQTAQIKIRTVWAHSRQDVILYRQP